jgi:2OG-Fe(II) oxygenase superfamily
MTQSLYLRELERIERIASDLSSSLVAESDRLSAEHFLALNDRSVMAVRIKDFYPEKWCKTFTETILCDSPIAGYNTAPNILRTGISLYDTSGNPDRLEEYFTQGYKMMTEERRLIGLSPMGKLRLELLEFQQGFRFETLDKRPLWMGSTRVFPNASFADPHIDSKKIDTPDCSEAQTIESQIAVNTYVQIPKSGGELEIYDFEPTKAELAELATDSYGLNRAKLPAPTLVLEPRLGELILFRSTNVHAVRPSVGTRVAQSCFLAYRGKDAAITGWS